MTSYASHSMVGIHLLYPHPEPLPSFSSILQSFNLTTWGLIFFSMLALNSGILLTFIVYKLNKKLLVNINPQTTSIGNLILLKTWSMITETVKSHLFMRNSAGHFLIRLLVFFTFAISQLYNMEFRSGLIRQEFADAMNDPYDIDMWKTPVFSKY